MNTDKNNFKYIFRDIRENIKFIKPDLLLRKDQDLEIMKIQNSINGLNVRMVTGETNFMRKKTET